MGKGDRNEYAAYRWAAAVERQADRMVEARRPIDAGDATDEALAEAWRWLDDAHFLLIAAGQLHKRLEALGWTTSYTRVDWQYLIHLRNAWEHDDDRGWYRREYRWPHGTGVWGAGQPGFLDDLNVSELLKVTAHVRDRVRRWAADSDG